jgi:acetolactate synthase I/II/III large subunit
MQMSGSDIIVEYLKAEGVTHVFGVVGSSILDLMDSLARSPQIRYVQTAHEQAAGYMADGYARVTGRPGICLATVGPGATNLLGGVAQAFLESSPVIALCGEVHTLHYGKGASNFHEIEQSLVYKPVTKLAVRIERADRIVEILSKAFRVAGSGRKGPVYLGLPRDVQKTKIAAPEIPSPRRIKAEGAVRGDAAQIRAAVELLLSASRPVLLAGGGLRWAAGRDAMTALAEYLGIPIALTHKGLIPEDHPLCVGVIGTTASPVAAETVQGSDLILAFGCTFSQVATGSYGTKIIPEKPRIVQVDIDPAEIGKNYPVELGIAGDARSVLEDMLALVRERGQGPRTNPERRAEIAALRAAWERSLLEEGATSDRVPITRLRMLHDLRAVLERDAIVAAESGATHGWFVYGFPCYEPILEPGDYSIMGSALCMAMSAKLAHPDRQVVSVTGDGAMMMVMSEIATAVANNIPIVIVVPHNGVYGNMLRKQHEHFEDRFIGTRLHVPDLAEVARALGAHGERVERPADLIPAYRRALASKRPALVDVVIGNDWDELEAPTKLRVADRY